jgi:hypothetical protein
MTNNQVVSIMFDFKTYNRMTRFILMDNEIEDPGSQCFDLGCDGMFMIYIET